MMVTVNFGLVRSDHQHSGSGWFDQNGSLVRDSCELW